MCGAVSCLSGFEGLEVVIHGSSGCYFYPASLIGRPIHSTLLIEEEVIFGSAERLRLTVEGVGASGQPIAVVQTCVPAVTGEDFGAMLDGGQVLLVDSPGFAGGMEEGYRRAIEALEPRVDPDQTGVTIDGLNPMDPFWRGNLLEAERLIRRAGGRVATAIAADRFETLKHCGQYVVSTNPGLSCGIGESAGNLLGLGATIAAFCCLADRNELDASPIIQEAEEAGGRIERACDKYLSRSDPPSVAIFAEEAYAGYAADTLRRYLDAEIVVCAPRTGPDAVTSLAEVRELIDDGQPDLILGSTYEQAAAPGIPYVPLTFPQRGRIRLHARPIVGIEGTLSLMDDVLTACGGRGS
ncbi:oxidoreductase [Methanofollis fontis]|uniref:Oxidoreductase n=2 Tax=Methanofollis fontis TaxID=2052832 RepID=A0A483CY93_9EURY|nr:oxidoreductase [Methanofollis fontis]